MFWVGMHLAAIGRIELLYDQQRAVVDVEAMETRTHLAGASWSGTARRRARVAGVEHQLIGP